MAIKEKNKATGLKSPAIKKTKSEVFKETMKKAREAGGTLVKQGKLKPL